MAGNFFVLVGALGVLESYVEVGVGCRETRQVDCLVQVSLPIFDERAITDLDTFEEKEAPGMVVKGTGILIDAHL